jgi:hypothetical protein
MPRVPRIFLSRVHDAHVVGVENLLQVAVKQALAVVDFSPSPKKHA